MESIKVISPASITNLGSGFDVFAMALKQPFDTIEVEVTDTGNVEIEVSGYPVPIEPRKNTGGYVALRMLEQFKIKDGLKIKLNKGVPVAAGIGSSSSCAAGVAFCINELFNLGLTKGELIHYASYGDIISAGEMTYDCVSASILGGFIIIVAREPLQVISLDAPEDLGIVVAIPYTESIERGSTKLSREAIPRTVPIGSLKENVGHASILSAGIALKNIDFIKKGMNDTVAEPARVRYGILKEFNKLKALGNEMNAGIAATGGSGSTVVGIIEKGRSEELADKMKDIFTKAGYKCDIIITECGQGIRKIE